ncbi:MAG: hypothetical protein JST81_11950 [Bacteroidetes bacterium]|nr:hypothetical protein [Bacteroidota bacterium]
MNNYLTVSEALNALFKRGYLLDFALLNDEDCIYCHNQNHRLNAEDFEIDEVYRFEGDTDPGDEMIVFAISSNKHNIKGTLLNAFGIYADSDNSNLIEKLKYKATEDIKPIKRANELIQLSRAHHHTLLLAWKIKTGLAKNIEPERIGKYVKWFFEHHLLPHFETEEKYIFPLLGELNNHKTMAIEQHEQVKDIIMNRLRDKDNLTLLHNLITENVRFEERILFKEIQNKCDFKPNREVVSLSTEKFCDNENDPFWK